MGLIKLLILKRVSLTALTVIVSAFSVVLTLWWNLQLSQIINAVGGGLGMPGMNWLRNKGQIESVESYEAL